MYKYRFFKSQLGDAGPQPQCCYWWQGIQFGVHSEDRTLVPHANGTNC